MATDAASIVIQVGYARLHQRCKQRASMQEKGVPKERPSIQMSLNSHKLNQCTRSNKALTHWEASTGQDALGGPLPRGRSVRVRLLQTFDS